MDTKLTTFLTVCRTMNYRKAAEKLHLTQPAVTKQIHTLESILNTTLFTYDGHVLHKTESCYLFEQYAISEHYNYEEIIMNIHKKKRTNLRIGATKTIGDYVLAPSLIKYLNTPEHELSLIVSNTKNLLNMLDENKLDFAIIEGTFSKSKYDYYLYLNEPFIGACSIDNPLCNQCVSIESLLGETIIVREEGSGTRSILESSLDINGYQLYDFNRTISISSFTTIKQLVKSNIGITFLYQSVIEHEESIGRFQVNDVTMSHEFNVVYTKNSAAKKYANLFLTS